MNDLSKEIDEIIQRFMENFGGLSHVQLNWKPDPETWSIAQNVEHLIVINESYFPIIDSVRQGTYKSPFTAKTGVMPWLFGKMLYKAVQPDRKMKVKTFPMWEPAKSDIPTDILDRFRKHQSELKNIIKSSENLVKRGAIISSPANKYIVFRLGKAFEIMVTHEERHLEQSKELYERMKSEAGS
jgi:hypothetical protein